MLGCVIMRAELFNMQLSLLCPLTTLVCIQPLHCAMFPLSSHQLMPELSEDFPWECERCNHSYWAPLVQIYIGYVDNMMSFCHLRHPSRHPADSTRYIMLWVSQRVLSWCLTCACWSECWILLSDAHSSVDWWRSIISVKGYIRQTLYTMICWW